jgi:predicted ATPase
MRRPLFFSGISWLARALFEQCRGLGDLDRALYEMDRYGSVLAYQAVTLAHLGHVDQARSCVDEAAARSRGHSFEATAVAVHAGWVECVASSPDAARRHAEQAIALASEHGFPVWLGWGSIYRGWSLTMLGQPEEGLTWLRKGLSACRASENAASVQFALILLATAYLKLGRTDEALQYLA